MPRESDQVLYEIFRETTYNNRYEVVYYTELDEKNRDYWINRALNGESFVSGFLPSENISAGKAVVQEILADLNNGRKLSPVEAEARLESISRSLER